MMQLNTDAEPVTPDTDTPGRAFLLGAACTAALGGLLFGFDTIVISGCQNQLKVLFQLDSFQQGFMTASAIIGTVIGALTAGRPVGSIAWRTVSWSTVGSTSIGLRRSNRNQRAEGD